MATSRRTFLKLGGLAALLAAAGGGIYRATRSPAAPGRFVLDGAAKAALDAIVPAMLADALPRAANAHRAAIEACSARVQAGIGGLPLAAQKEVQDLFGLLALGPVRRFLAGVPVDWPDAAPAQVAAFLQDWRTHRFTMLQSAYAALHDLIIGAWYADPSSWEAIGYPGPPEELA